MSESPKIAVVRVLTQFSYFALLVSVALGVWVWPGPEREPNIAVFLLKMLPLLAFAAGVIKLAPRGLIWLCFVVQLYFAAAVIAVLGPNTQPPHWADLIFSITLFTAAMLFISWSGKARRGEN